MKQIVSAGAVGVLVVVVISVAAFLYLTPAPDAPIIATAPPPMPEWSSANRVSVAGVPHYTRHDGELKPVTDLDIESDDWTYRKTETNEAVTLQIAEDILTIPKANTVFIYTEDKISPVVTYTKEELKAVKTNINDTHAYTTFPYTMNRKPICVTNTTLCFDKLRFDAGNDHIVVYDDGGAKLNCSGYDFKIVDDEIRLYYDKAAIGQLSGDLTFELHSWSINNDIISGLTDVGMRSAPSVFQMDSTWYLISGKDAGVWNGWHWTGSTWATNSTIISGLTDVGSDSNPSVFQMDSTWYLISGEMDGVWNGWNIPTPTAYTPPDPANLQHTTSVGWVNYTWSAGTGNVTDSYNVLHNAVWSNGSANAYKNSEVGGGNWANITVYAYNNSAGTLSAGSVSDQNIAPSPAAPAIPPDPTTLTNTTGNFWVNHTWSAGTGNVTDSYRVYQNGTWHNSTANPYYNATTVGAHGYSDITVYAYNSSSSGTLSAGNIAQNTTLPNNPITITNTAGWSGIPGANVPVDYDAIDADGDTPTFSCNRTDLFSDFSTATGVGNWIFTSGTLYVDFGVSDGYGSTSNYTMVITEDVASKPPSPVNIGHTTGNFWVNHTWSAGTGNVTDSYRVYVNGVWHNSTLTPYYKDTYSAHAWQNITVYAWNSSGIGTLSD